MTLFGKATNPELQRVGRLGEGEEVVKAHFN